MSTKYSTLPYWENEHMPSCRYSKASDIRTPLRHAINTARDLPTSHMDEVLAILEAAIAHIRSKDDDTQIVSAPTNDPVPVSDDPLDVLLGTAKAEPDSRISGLEGRRIS